jgi:hypothetical protein
MRIVAILHIDSKQAMKYQVTAPWKVHGNNHNNSDSELIRWYYGNHPVAVLCVGYTEENDIVMRRRECRSEGLARRERRFASCRPWKVHVSGVGFVIIIKLKWVSWVRDLRSATEIMDSYK